MSEQVRYCPRRWMHYLIDKPEGWPEGANVVFEWADGTWVFQKHTLIGTEWQGLNNHTTYYDFEYIDSWPSERLFEIIPRDLHPCLFGMCRRQIDNIIAEEGKTLVVLVAAIVLLYLLADCMG